MSAIGTLTRRVIIAFLSVGVALSPFPPALLSMTQAGAMTSASVTPADVTKSTATTYAVTFTPATAITGGGSLSVNFQAPPDARFGVSSAAVATGSAAVFQSVTDTNSEFGSINVSFTSLPAAQVTLNLSGIVNPAKEGRYSFSLTTFSQMGMIDQGGGQVTIGTIAVMGTVQLPNGTGAVGAYVDATDKSDPSKHLGSPTSQDGSFGIGGLTSGRTYSVSVFIGQSGDQNSNTDGFTSPDPVTVTYAGSKLTQNFILKAATKTISGTMTRTSGKPVSGGRIFISRTDVFGSGTQATTDATGKYTAKIAGGKYEVRPDTWAAPGEAAPDYAYSGQGKLISFAKDDTVESKTGVDFSVVTATATVKGTVTPDPGGFAGIGVMSEGSQGGNGVFTGIQNGAFSMKVAPGTYRLEFGQDPSQAGDKYALPSMAPFTIADGETKNMGALTLVKMDKTISATVRDKDTKKGIAGFGVGCFKPGGGGFAMGQTDGNGVATVKVIEGDWGCMAMAGFGKEGSKEQALRDVFQFIETAHAAEGSSDTKYVVQGGPKFVKISGSTAATLTFDAVKADRTITVTVTDTAGNALSEHGFVEAELVSSSAGSDFDNGGGLGQPIDPNQPGVATLSVPAGVYNLRMMTPPGSDYSSGDPVKVDVTSANASATIKLLKNDAIIKGTLKDEDGNTVKGVFAFVSATNKKGAFIPGEVNTDAGTFSMRVPSAGGAVNLGYFVEPSSGYFPQPFGDATVTPKSGETITKDITMKKATTTVTVTVKDPDGKAIAGAFVEADNRSADSSKKVESFFHNGAETNSEGKAELKLPAGTFSIEAFVPPTTLASNKWIPPKSEPVTLAKGDSKSVTLTFQKSDATISGKVTTSSGSAVDGAFVTAYSDSGESITTTTGSDGSYSLNVKQGTVWHVVAEKDDTSSGSGSPLLSNESIWDGSGSTKTINLTLEDKGTLSSTISSTFDTDNAKVVTVNDGDLKGAIVSMPADALDTDSQGSNATVTVETTVEVARELSDKPIGDIALDVTAQNSSGSSISSLASSSTSVTIPVEQGDLTAAGFKSTDVGNSVTMSYYDKTNGKWTPLEGSVTGTLSDNTGDGDTDDAKDLVLVTGNTDHFTTFAVTAATDTTAPSAPSDPSATDTKTGGAINLGWTNPSDSDFAKIKLYRSETEGTVGSALTTIDSKTTTSYADTGLTNGTKYFYVIRSLDASGNESTNTTQVSATPSGTTKLPKTGSSSSRGWLLLGLIALGGTLLATRRFVSHTHQ